MQQVTLSTRKGKEETHISWDEYALRWDAQAGGDLAQIARALRANRRRRRRPDRRRRSLRVAAQTALARVQAQQSTWTRADLMKQIGLAMPRGVTQPGPGRRRGPGAGPDRPGDPRRVRGSRRADPAGVPGHAGLPAPGAGRPVGLHPARLERYATHVQLSLEERLCSPRSARPRRSWSREEAALLLGADPAASTRSCARGPLQARASGQVTGVGAAPGPGRRAALRADLAAHRRGAGRAGRVSGKTRTLAEAARIWQATGRPVIGLATAQAARNVLAAAGVPLAENTAQFLGHLPGSAERGASASFSRARSSSSMKRR